MKVNRIISKTFLHSLFWKQNKHHKHGVFLHTMRVCYYTLKHREFKMLPAALLHDVGKPFVAYQDDRDEKVGEYSFTDHEEASYQIIKGWPFVSEYTKVLVRYHYLIRDIHLCKKREKWERHDEKFAIWNTLEDDVKEDLRRFLEYDDMGKGRKKHKEFDRPGYLE